MSADDLPALLRHFRDYSDKTHFPRGFVPQATLTDHHHYRLQPAIAAVDVT